MNVWEEVAGENIARRVMENECIRECLRMSAAMDARRKARKPHPKRPREVRVALQKQRREEYLREVGREEVV